MSIHMYLKTLSLKNYRNIKDLKIDFHPEFNFIFGKNAQGKTNLIESIYYLAELKSFRAANRHDIINKEADFSQVHSVFEKDDLSWDINITLTADERRVLLNQKKPKRRIDYYELIPLILFEPRHIYLFRDSPSERRKYMNRALYVQDVNVLSLIRDYEKVIANKNRLLKDGVTLELLDVWNERLAKLAAEIVYKRQQWLREVEQLLTKEYRAISRTKETLKLVYRSSVRALCDDFSRPEADIHHCFKEALLESSDKEMQRRESFIGPHRDDFTVCIDDRNIGALGSQGENRSAIIALKLAQLKMFAAKYKKTPLFLLDDVASELDEERCRHLFAYLKKERTQVFLTTTDNTLSANDFAGHATSFFVENGTIKAMA